MRQEVIKDKWIQQPEFDNEQHRQKRIDEKRRSNIESKIFKFFPHLSRLVFWNLNNFIVLQADRSSSQLGDGFCFLGYVMKKKRSDRYFSDTTHFLVFCVFICHRSSFSLK